jgi:putative membrane protein
MSARATALAWLAGAGLLAWLLLRQDWPSFAPALLDTGWGFVWLGLYHLVPVLFDTLAWRAVLPGTSRPPLLALLRMRWHGESVNTLLPAAQVGGDLLRARLAALAGVPGPVAAASVLVDLTLSVLTLLPFAGAGVLFLALTAGDARYSMALAAGSVLATLAVAGFWILQRSRLLAQALHSFSAGRGGSWQNLAGNAAAFAAALDALYRDRRALARSTALQLAAWCAGAGEVWLALWLLGQPVGPIEALLVESLAQAIRNAAFFVPGALGIQDGGLMLIAPLVGVPADAGLALSLLKRGREAMLGLPGIVDCYWLSARRLAA